MQKMLLGFSLVVLLVAFAAFAGFAGMRKNGSVESKTALTKKTSNVKTVAQYMPRALTKHREDLLKATPADVQESFEKGPQGGGDEELFNLAYPAADIPLERITTARTAYGKLKTRKLPKGAGQPGAWTSVGPSQALYPIFEFRDATQYVPGSYIASGRITSMVIAPGCNSSKCRIYIGAAGGGIWRTDKALSSNPTWTYLSNPFEINAIGSVALDPNDASGNTIWVGTGEFNACGDCSHGAGVYKSTDGGNTWSAPLGQSVFNGRAVGTIAVKPGDPNTVYAGSGRGVHGVSSVTGGAESILIPNAAMWGLYKSTDGGANWTLVHNGSPDVTLCSTNPATVAANLDPCSPRGVRLIEFDPADPNTLYSSAYSRGIWRTNDNGLTWTQILPALNAANISNRAHFDVTLLGGDTRMYVGEGISGAPTSRLFRSDSVRTGVPTFTNLTSSSVADDGYGSFDYCGGQCWYDNFVYTPDGYPDVVYLGGSYQYGENDPFPPGVAWVSNGRGVVLSQNAGVSFTDMSYDSTDLLHPNGLHPDHHALVTAPGNPFLFFEAGDGGIVRSSGQLTNHSAQCATFRGLAGTDLARCQQMLSAIPTKIYSINKGLTTLQFQSISVNPFDPSDLQGGTQDNGTWESYGNPVKWVNTMIGDGGQSGFDISNSAVRFHTFTGLASNINFSSGDTYDWNWIAGAFNEAAAFYAPIISDPVVGGTMYAGSQHVWRTKTNGMGSMTVDEYRQHCNFWTGDFTVLCGDWLRLGNAAAAGALTNASFGDRPGGTVAAVERARGDSSTVWAATSTGRVFVSKNSDAEPASAVVFTRIDSLSGTDPNRFVSSIFVDPSDPNHAWISYGGFSANTPLTPGHIFSVTFDPVASTATWLSLDGSGTGAVGDIPLNDVAFDDVTGDLYVSCDFGVFREPGVSGTTWILSGPGLPAVETAGLTILPAQRILYAATHGLGAWRLNLP